MFRREAGRTLPGKTGQRDMDRIPDESGEGKYKLFGNFRWNDNSIVSELILLRYIVGETHPTSITESSRISLHVEYTFIFLWENCSGDHLRIGGRGSYWGSKQDLHVVWLSRILEKGTRYSAILLQQGWGCEANCELCEQNCYRYHSCFITQSGEKWRFMITLQFEFGNVTVNDSSFRIQGYAASFAELTGVFRKVNQYGTVSYSFFLLHLFL